MNITSAGKLLISSCHCLVRIRIALHRCSQVNFHTRLGHCSRDDLQVSRTITSKFVFEVLVAAVYLILNRL